MGGSGPGAEDRELASDAGVIDDQRCVGPDRGALRQGARLAPAATASAPGRPPPLSAASRMAVFDRLHERVPSGNGIGRRDRDAGQDPGPETESERCVPTRRGRGGDVGHRALGPGCRRSGRRTRVARSWPIVTTATPRVSRYSSVAGTSRIDFGPAHTTATAVRASSSRSDEMSRVVARRSRRDGHPFPRCANTAIPAECAAIIVAETVVAAQPPACNAAARLGRAALRTEPAGAVARASRTPWFETDEDPAIANGNGGRQRTGGHDRSLRRDRHVEVLGVRQTVADQGRIRGLPRDTPPASAAEDRGSDREPVGDVA